jgi:protein arginine N-methyltransferase 5
MYRQTDNRKVWYEWIIEVFALEKIVLAPSSPSPSHIPDAAVKENAKEIGTGKPGVGGGLRRVRIAMSELHSSIKDGCLM